MFINWFTVVAQIVNFLILVWLLRRFLYKPVLNAIEKREKRIAAELEEADKKKAEAEEEQKEYQEKKAEIEANRDSLLKKATLEAQEEQQRLLEEARTNYEDLRSRLEKTLQEEQEQLAGELKSRTEQEIFAISGKVLADLSNGSLEQQIMEVFLQKITSLSEEERLDLISASNLEKNPILVKTGFDLDSQQQEKLRAALQQIMKQEVHLNFQTSRDLIGGIELSANGYKLSWSIADYLGTIKAGLADEIKSTPEVQLHNTSKDDR